MTMARMVGLTLPLRAPVMSAIVAVTGRSNAKSAKTKRHTSQMLTEERSRGCVRKPDSLIAEARQKTAREWSRFSLVPEQVSIVDHLASHHGHDRDGLGQIVRRHRKNILR